MRATIAAQALAVTMVDEFARAGVTNAVIAPGSRSAPLAIALHADARVRLHVQIDERSAAFLGLGLAKATGLPVVVVCTSGTAAANFHPAVIEAHQTRTPLLVLTADRPPELRDAAANQTIDQVKLYGTAVRWFAEVGVPEARAESVPYWRSLAARAVATAAGAGAPAGPVHLNVALREPLVALPGAAGDFGFPLDGRDDGRPWTATAGSGRWPHPAEVDEIAAQLDGVERGLLVAGDGDFDPHPFVAVAAVLGWPVLAEPSSGARYGRNAISTYHALLGDEAVARAHAPDLVLRVGKVGLSKPLLALLARTPRQILVDRDGAWLDPGRSVARIVSAEPGLLFVGLAKALTPRPPSDWLVWWRRAECRARLAIDALLDDHVAPSEPRTARDLATLAPARTVLTVASSMPIRDLDAVMHPRRDLRVLANRGASGIDGFVSTALGVALAASEPSLALAGDLSLLHDTNGLLLDERPDLTLVVVNNDGGGIFSFLPQAQLETGFERLFATPHKRDLRVLAKLHGCGYTRLERAAELGDVLTHARRAGGVHLIEVRTDRAANRLLHRDLQEAVSQAVHNA